MSHIRHIEHACVDCGFTMSLDMANSANFMDGEVAEDMISGKARVGTCIKCGRENTVDMSMLYSDIIEGRFIWYVPKGHKLPENSEVLGVITEVHHDYNEFAGAVAKAYGLEA